MIAAPILLLTTVADAAVALGHMSPAQGRAFVDAAPPTAADEERLAAAEAKRRRRAMKRKGERS